MQEVFSELAPLRAETASADPVEFCRKAWSILGRLYVVNAADSSRIAWGRCELPNERNFLQYWQANILPSIQKLRIVEDLARVKARVLTIHGRRDRNAPYGGGRQCASSQSRTPPTHRGSRRWIPFSEQSERSWGTNGRRAPKSSRRSMRNRPLEIDSGDANVTRDAERADDFCFGQDCIRILVAWSKRA
jgi:hypothetical protein